MASCSIINTSSGSISKLNANTNKLPLPNYLNQISNNNENATVASSRNEEDQEEMISTIPPPMNVIKPEHSEQVRFIKRV
jgi:hypothetical protein